MPVNCIVLSLDHDAWSLFLPIGYTADSKMSGNQDIRKHGNHRRRQNSDDGCRHAPARAGLRRCLPARGHVLHDNPRQLDHEFAQPLVFGAHLRNIISRCTGDA
jgi:hypothetical protein